jgi:hypothetical protein
VDRDGDGIPEMELRFRFEKVRPLLAPGSNTLNLSGHAGNKEFRGSDTIVVTSLAADLRVTPRTLKQASSGEDVQARVTFREEADAEDVSISSVRLNETVPVKRVVLQHDHVLVLKFDRAAVENVLPVGDTVEVRVTGTLHGIAFTARDSIAVIY